MKFNIGDLVEVGPVRAGNFPVGTLGIILKRHAITDKHYFVYMPNGETQIMSYKWIRKVS